jgi:hypothetical protein
VRFDDINLVGNFTINGLTGPSGRVLGVTNGVIGWIPVSTSGGGGGGVGPQGATGPYLFNFSKGRIVASGFRSLVQSASSVKFYKSSNNFINDSNLGSSYIGGTNYFSSNVVFSSSFGYCYGTNNSVISSGYSGLVQYLSVLDPVRVSINNSSVISSDRGTIQKDVYTANEYSSSIILSSKYANFRRSNNSSIVSSYYANNALLGIPKNTSLVATTRSCADSHNNVVMSAYQSCVIGSTNSVVLATDRGTIYQSINSTIIGGDQNIINNSSESVILGGNHNSLTNTKNTVILGGAYITASNVVNTTLAQKVEKIQKVIFLPLASDPSPVENGMMWYRNNQLYIRLNGATGTFSLVR